MWHSVAEDNFEVGSKNSDAAFQNLETPSNLSSAKVALSFKLIAVAGHPVHRTFLSVNQRSVEARGLWNLSPPAPGMPWRGETMVHFLRFSILWARKFSTQQWQQRENTSIKTECPIRLPSGKSPKISSAFGAVRTWGILIFLPEFWIFELSPKATPFAKSPKISQDSGSNNYLFSILFYLTVLKVDSSP